MDDRYRILIWKRFQAGDDDALTQLYREYSHQMYSYGQRISNDIGLVNDCIRDVFLQLIDRRKNIEITSGIQVYLFKSLRNKLIEEFRSNGRIEFISRKRCDFEPNTEQILNRSNSEGDIKARLGRLMEVLPQRQKEILYLKFTENMNLDEIAELLQIDNASACKLLYRSIKAMKEQEEFMFLPA